MKIPGYSVGIWTLVLLISVSIYALRLRQTYEFTDYLPIEPADTTSAYNPDEGGDYFDREGLTFIGKFTASFLMLFPSVYVLLSKKYQEGEKKWAYGPIGTVVGFWFG
jgi:hypothetical protein